MTLARLSTVFAILLWGVATSAVAEEKRPWSGDLGFSFAYNRTSYVSRKLALEGDVTYKYNHNEMVSEALLDRQYALLPGTATAITNYKYDANVKWKRYFTESPYYAYLSPRVRHNDSGFFRGAQSMRIGGGRKILLDEDRFEMTVELGAGYRFASLADQSQIREGLFTFSDKFTWEINSDLSLKLNLVHEQSAREKYRTTTLELKNKLSHNFGLKYQIMQKRTYPFDTTEPGGEVISSIGLDYEI